MVLRRAWRGEGIWWEAANESHEVWNLFISASNFHLCRKLLRSFPRINTERKGRRRRGGRGRHIKWMKSFINHVYIAWRCLSSALSPLFSYNRKRNFFRLVLCVESGSSRASERVASLGNSSLFRLFRYLRYHLFPRLQNSFDIARRGIEKRAKNFCLERRERNTSTVSLELFFFAPKSGALK